MATSIPSAVPAFISVATAALPANFQVVFSKVFNPYVAPQTLSITAIRVTEDQYAELGPNYRHEEHFNIECTLCGTSGSPTDQTTVFSAVYALYDDIAVAVANNPTLNSTIRLAWCRQLGYDPGADAKGLIVGALDFEVQCQQRVTSLS